jgi:hypothetical protein
VLGNPLIQIQYFFLNTSIPEAFCPCLSLSRRMSRGVAERQRKPLEIKRTQLQLARDMAAE